MAEDRFSAVRSPRYSGGRALGFRSSSLPPSPGQSAAQASRPQPAIAGFDAPRGGGFIDGGGDPSAAAPSSPASGNTGVSAAQGFATVAAVMGAMANPNVMSVMNAVQAINNFAEQTPPNPTVDPALGIDAPFTISEMAMTPDPSDPPDAAVGGEGVDSGPADADAGVSAAAPGTGVGEGGPGSGTGSGATGDGSGVGDGSAAAAAADGASAASASGGGDGGGGACFITEAVMASGGQGDQAPELEILRYFRDKVMMSNPVGQMLVQQYYTIAPLVVDAVSARPDGMQIFQTIKGEYIDKAIQHIQAGQMEEALRCYAEMIAFTTPFAIEATMGPGGQPDDAPAPGQEPLDDFATDAAMVAQSPEMAAQATGAQPSVPPIGGQMPGSYTGPMANPPQEPAISGMFARPQAPLAQQPRRY